MKTFTLTLNESIEIKSSNLKDIIGAFLKLITPLFEKYCQQVLKAYAEKYMFDGTLKNMLSSKKITWKSKTGKLTASILTIFGKIRLPEFQAVNHDTGKRMNITRVLLGIKPRIQIPAITAKAIGLMGSLASYRVVKKITSLFSDIKLSLMTIMRCIRKTGESIKFEIDKNQAPEFEADGTGLPILHSGKRGKELKVLAQRKKTGGIIIAGMIIDSYKKGWEKIFEPIKNNIKSFFKSIVLVTDGDTSIFKGGKGINVIIQRCLFHIVHEAKYTLREDQVKRRSNDWIYILSELIDICTVTRIKEDDVVGKKVIKKKKERLSNLISFCMHHNYTHTTSFLTNALPDAFSGIERRILGGTTSLIERVMRTVNMRINIGQWSAKSALAVCNIRGAYYYNGFDI